MNNTKRHFLIGAHMSIAGGIEKAIERASSINSTVLQLFTHNNRQWFSKPFTRDQAALFKATQEKSSIGTIVAHASYLINLGSPNQETNKKAASAVKHELKLCKQLDIPYLVLHPGSHVSSTESECLKKIADNLSAILDSTESNTTILLETMAGQGTTVGRTFEQLAHIKEMIPPTHQDRIQFCLDTCHIFAAGYDIRTEETYNETIAACDSILGLESIRTIHINDSKKELGSYVDRHEHIGQGKLGLKPFELIFNDERLFAIPKILETPKNDLSDDLRNIETIKGLVNQKTREKLIIF